MWAILILSPSNRKYLCIFKLGTPKGLSIPGNPKRLHCGIHTIFISNRNTRLTHTVLLPILLVKSTMVQSTGTNNIGLD